jgi:hypothetical protein
MDGESYIDMQIHRQALNRHREYYHMKTPSNPPLDRISEDRSAVWR